MFASYSHRDLGIVEEMEQHARSFGDEYLRDWVHLRSGERWNDGLQQLIRAADVFQLFWSPNAARSEFVAQEWQYALALDRDTFVRPTYWHDPMPDPPEALRPLHFHRLAVSVGSTATSTPIAPLEPPVAPASTQVLPAPEVQAPPSYASASHAPASANQPSQTFLRSTFALFFAVILLAAAAVALAVRFR